MPRIAPVPTGTNRIAELALITDRLQSDVVRLLPATRPGTTLMAHDGHHPGQESSSSSTYSMTATSASRSIERSVCLSVCLLGYLAAAFMWKFALLLLELLRVLAASLGFSTLGALCFDFVAYFPHIQFSSIFLQRLLNGSNR